LGYGERIGAFHATFARTTGLAEHGVTKQAVANFTLHGIVRQTFSRSRTKPVVVERVKRRTSTRKERMRPEGFR
jgi:hypothetical protein